MENQKLQPTTYTADSLLFDNGNEKLVKLLVLHFTKQVLTSQKKNNQFDAQMIGSSQKPVEKLNRQM